LEIEAERAERDLKLESGGERTQTSPEGKLDSGWASGMGEEGCCRTKKQAVIIHGGAQEEEEICQGMKLLECPRKRGGRRENNGRIGKEKRWLRARRLAPIKASLAAWGTGQTNTHKKKIVWNVSLEEDR